MTKTKRTGGMILGILFIGLCVSFLRLSQFGVDPFSAMNLEWQLYWMELWNVADACQCNHFTYPYYFRQDPASWLRGPLSIWYLSDTLQTLFVM